MRVSTVAATMLLNQAPTDESPYRIRVDISSSVGPLRICNLDVIQLLEGKGYAKVTSIFRVQSTQIPDTQSFYVRQRASDLGHVDGRNPVAFCIKTLKIMAVFCVLGRAGKHHQYDLGTALSGVVELGCGPLMVLVSGMFLVVMS